ncbi:MAG: phosphate ABC transporter permease subunit PstC [Candidatus Caenarcaniphilales bacterium]|nr:phosphate ABC transporter permease subunit PstC [Candidatus Caenarcaniphilales bacterium]
MNSAQIFKQVNNLAERSRKNRSMLEGLFKFLFSASLVLSVLLLVLIALYIFWNGLQLFGTIAPFDVLTGIDWSPSSDKFGIFPMILSSLLITFLAIMISAPIGIACAVCAAEISHNWYKNLIQAAVQILGGTPSVVFGLIGLSAIVPWIQQFSNSSGLSILAAVIILSIMILPTIVVISQDAIESVPHELKQASLALGATHFQTILKVILPVAKPGITAALVLSVSRAFGEAMAVKMVIGNRQTMPDFIPETFFGLLSSARTLTTNIIGDIEYAKEGSHLQALFMTGAVLFVVIMIVNYIAYVFTSKSAHLRGRS